MADAASSWPAKPMSEWKTTKSPGKTSAVTTTPVQPGNPGMPSNNGSASHRDNATAANPDGTSPNRLVRPGASSRESERPSKASSEASVSALASMVVRPRPDAATPVDSSAAAIAKAVPRMLISQTSWPSYGCGPSPPNCRPKPLASRSISAMGKSFWKGVIRPRVWRFTATAMLLTSPVAMEGNATSIPKTSGLIKAARLSLDRRNSRSR